MWERRCEYNQMDNTDFIQSNVYTVKCKLKKKDIFKIFFRLYICLKSINVGPTVTTGLQLSIVSVFFFFMGQTKVNLYHICKELQKPSLILKLKRTKPNYK